MALITLMTHFDAVSGKYAKTDKVYTRVRKFDNCTIGIRLKNPVSNDPPTEGQKTAQDKFKTVQGKVATALADPAKRATYVQEWKAQHKYKTLRTYVFAQLYNEETT